MNHERINKKRQVSLDGLHIALLSPVFFQGGGRWFDDGFVQHQAAEICFEGPTLRFAVEMPDPESMVSNLWFIFQGSGYQHLQC